MKHKKYIYGIGGFAKEVENYFKEQNIVIDGFVTDLSEHWGYRYNGTTCCSLEILENSSVFISLGAPSVRKYVVQLLKEENINVEFPIFNLSYPKYGEVNIGEGTILCPRSIITCNIEIGKFVNVNVGVVVGHDVVLGDFVTISPNAVIGGNSVVGDNTFIGMNVSIVEKTTIGKNCIIGAGAVVTKDLPDNVLAVGVPAKVIKNVS